METFDSTISSLDPSIGRGWLSASRQRSTGPFTRQTRITVEYLPAPETTVEQLATWRKLLEGGAKVPDVYGMDVIFPAILSDNVLDLRVRSKRSQRIFQELIANNTVNSRLVALPAKFSEGMLFYRLDLLRKYA